jgi:hypothetical protein
MLSYCNYYQNQAKVASSSLVTLAISHYFQTLCFLPFFKAGQGFAYHLVNYFTIPILFQYYVNTIFLLHKVGDLLVTKNYNGDKFFTCNPLDILYANMHIYNNKRK